MRPQITIGSLVLTALLAGASIVPVLAKEPPIDVGLAPDRLLFVRSGATAGSDGIMSVSSATGSVSAFLPLGVADADWSVLYAATVRGNETLVTAYDPRSGGTLRTLVVAGSWALPMVVPSAAPEGLSADGQRLVLLDQAPAPGTSRFALLDTRLGADPKIVTLDGVFTYDALSPDGQSLYLIEPEGNPGSGQYQVRLYDATHHELVQDPIVDKRNLDEQMEGRPVARTASADGIWVHTLYVTSDGGAFVHQLNTVERYALCAGLPGNASTPAEAAAWRLAVHSTNAPFAANGRLGIVAAVDNGNLRLSRSFRAAGDEAGLAISPDGRMLYLSAPDGLTTMSSGRLEATGEPVWTQELAGVSVEPDGEWLYGISRDGSDLVIVQLADGVPAGVGWVSIAPGSTQAVGLLGSTGAGASLAQGQN